MVDAMCAGKGALKDGMEVEFLQILQHTRKCELPVLSFCATTRALLRVRVYILP
jgi:hypothetical protein